MAGVTLDVIIVTATGSVEFVDVCLSSLRRAGPTLASLTVTVIDNASADGLLDMMRECHPWVAVQALAENRGFAAAVNVGIAATSGEFLLLLNPDTEVPCGSLDRLLSAIAARRGRGRRRPDDGRPPPRAAASPPARAPGRCRRRRRRRLRRPVPKDAAAGER